MNVVNVRGLQKSYGTRTIFEGVSCAIDEGEKVGFVGVNGSGKSTLFRIVAGLEGYNGGDVALRRGITTRYLAQEPDFAAGETIRAAVVAAHVPAPHEEEWDWMHRVEAMLTRLGVADWDRPVAGLSGGEAKRVALARALLAQPELLLLDEPTNHLDADTTLFLEEYLVDYPGAVMLITHDRYFLDRVVDRMIEVATGELTPYPGGYTEYLAAQAERAERQATVDARRRKLIEQELEWAKRSPPARTGKQKARIQRAQELRTESERYRGRQTRELTLHTPQSQRLGRSVLDLHHVSKAFGERTLIRDFSTMLRAGERIGIIGPNGAGKTTLVRMILGQVPVDHGEIDIGSNTHIAYFDQQRAQLDNELSVYEAVGGTDWVEVEGRRIHLRSYLEDFLFPTERQQQKVSSLSGGERNRLMLAKLFLQPSNLLILDEPTNDLDLVTLQVLEAALLDYPGCVLMVTHDRFFLDKIATALLVFEGNGTVHRHDGGFDLYRRLRDLRAAETTTTPRTRKQPPTPRDTDTDSAKKLTWKEQRELESLETRIPEAEAHRDSLAARLADPDLYQDPDRALAATAAFHDAERAIAALYERWTELADRT